MAVTKQTAMRTALHADLLTISVANGYATDVAEVYADPVALEKIRTPAIMFWPIEGGDSQVETFGNERAVIEQNFQLVLVVRADNPHTAAENLIDDVRWAVGKPTSSSRTIAYGAGIASEEAHLVSWTEILTSEDLHNKWGIVECTVQIRLIYPRNNHG